MKIYIVSFILAAVMCTLSGTAMGDSIKGKLGVTGRLGFMIPSGSKLYTGYTIVPGFVVTEKEKADTAFVGGGGFIFGVTDNLAVVVDVTHAPKVDYKLSRIRLFNISTTTVSLGGQLRFFAEHKLVPYVGAGMDILFSDGKYVDYIDYVDKDLDIETVVGGDVNAGIDLFITQRIALNLEFRGVWFPKADLTSDSPILITGEYDPSSFIGLFGARYFFN